MSTTQLSFQVFQRDMWQKQCQYVRAKLGEKRFIDSSVYRINIYVDGCLEFKSIEALSGDIGDYDLIIGMDIITLGDFVISNKDNQTWFAFRYPSSDHIEF